MMTKKKKRKRNLGPRTDIESPKPITYFFLPLTSQIKMTITNKKRDIAGFPILDIYMLFYSMAKVQLLTNQQLLISCAYKIFKKHNLMTYIISRNGKKHKYLFIYYVNNVQIFFKQSGKLHRNLSSRTLHFISLRYDRNESD